MRHLTTFVVTCGLAFTGYWQAFTSPASDPAGRLAHWTHFTIADSLPGSAWGTAGPVLGAWTAPRAADRPKEPSSPSSEAGQQAPVAYRLTERGARSVVLDGQGKLVGEFVPWTNDAVEARDAFEALGANRILWRRTFALKPGHPKQPVRLTMDFQAAHKSRFTMIPGVSWNGNPGDPGNVYRGLTREGTPWSLAWHRTLIPGATYSEGETHSVGLFAAVIDPRTGLSCSLLPKEKNTIHRLIFPEEELPKRVLIRERGLSPGRAKVFELATGESYQATAWLVLHPVTRPKTGYRHLLDAAWAQAFKETAACHAAGELWTMGIRFAKESLWDDQAKMFHLALACQNNRQWSQACGFSIGWCGRNGELANALLVDYLRFCSPRIASAASPRKLTRCKKKISNRLPWEGGRSNRSPW